MEVVVVVTFNKIGVHLLVFAFGLISLAATSLKLCFFMLCYVTLFICLYSCPIKHVPVESACSAGEIRRLELVFAAYVHSFHYSTMLAGGSARSAVES